MSKHGFFLFLRYFLLIVAVGVAIFLLVRVKPGAEAAGYENPPPAVVIARPVPGDLAIGITLSGHVEVRSMIAVVPLASGTITEYHAVVGERVREEDLLAVIDERPYRQQMLQAQSAQIVARTTFDRVERLYAANAVPRQTYEEALAQRDSADAQLELAQLQLAYTRVIAPVSGTVIKADAAKGQIASTQAPLAVIADLDDVLVRLQVPERYFDLFVKNRDSLHAVVSRTSTDGTTVTANAVIETIAPYIDGQSKTFEVVCHIEDATSVFAPGMYVDVRIDHTMLSDVLLLKQSDRTIDGSLYAYNEETSSARWLEITPVAQNDLFIAIPPEYRNTRFIVEGQHTVLDGQQVRVTGERQE